jgi:hypothetical protein
MTTPGTKPCEYLTLFRLKNARRHDVQLCVLPMALALLLGPARAQAPEHSTDEAPPELPADAPLDLRRRSLTPASSRA